MTHDELEEKLGTKLPPFVNNKNQLPKGMKLALEDDQSKEELENTFGVFYRMKIMKKAAKGCKGKTGKDFKECVGNNMDEIQKNYNIFDYYGNLKERG